MNIDLDNTLELVVVWAKEVGEVQRSYFRSGHLELETKSTVHDVVTKVDKLSESMLIERIGKCFPDHSVLGEESGEHDAHSDYLWVVDPLDGTKEFIKRNGEFTVNIALVENGIPVLGVIYVPVSRTLYFSEDSIGAYRIEGIDARSAGLSPDDLMEKADRLPLEQADTKGFVIVASRSHLSPETEEYIRKLESEYGHVNLISCGSSLKICRVAEGSADIYPRFAPTMEWDTAAGHAIVRASGKNIYLTDERTPLHYNKENLLNPWFIVK